MKKAFLLVAALVVFSLGFKQTSDEYAVDVSKSTLEWVGKKVTGQHNGYIKLGSGKLEMEGANLTGGYFEIDMTTIENEDITDEDSRQKLVGHLKSDDFFGVSTYPKAMLTITKVSKENSETGNYKLTGDLTIKGKTHPVEFTADVKENGGMIEAKAAIIFDRSKYDVKYGSGSFFDDLGDRLIYDEVEMNVNLIAAK
jgi:polyisoprenoid-binding protein YceI